MSEPVLYAPPRTVDAPMFDGPVAGLLSLARDLTPVGDEGWIGGYEYNARYPAHTVRNRSPYDLAVVGSNVGSGVAPSDVRVRPWMMEIGQFVSTFARNTEDWVALNRSLLDAYTSKLLERELWVGEIKAGEDLPNPVLARLTAVTVPGTFKPQAAVAELMQSMADAGMVDPVMIHAPRRVGLRMPDAWRNADTMNDHGFVVVSGAGYPGTGPAGTGNNWVYATGQVSYRLGPYDVLPGDLREAVNLAANDIMIRVQRYAGVDFTGPVHAVQVDLS